MIIFFAVTGMLAVIIFGAIWALYKYDQINRPVNIVQCANVSINNALEVWWSKNEKRVKRKIQENIWNEREKSKEWGLEDDEHGEYPDIPNIKGVKV